MAKVKPIDLTPIIEMKSAADFYGWKNYIVAAMESKDAAYAATLSSTNSVYDFFMQKETILKKLELVS
jgi:hypothetical protein